eukprot:Em0003g1238a
MAAFVASAVSYISHLFDTPYDPVRVDMPMDPEEPCYSLSFSKDQVNEYREFFDKYGYVVVQDVLSSDQCLATIDDMWSYIETKGYNWVKRDEEIINPIRRDAPSTWDNGWPSGQAGGFAGNRPIFTKRAQENRQNPDVYNVFANLTGEKELMVNQDRYALFRPTTDQEGKMIHAEWASLPNVHLDMNPWVFTLPHGEGKELNLESLAYEESNDFFEENNHPGRYEDRKLHLQGLINLADNRNEDGGFIVVPGFHKIFLQWTEHTRSTLGKQYTNTMSFILLDEKDPVWSHAQRVTARAGSLVVWNQLVAHGSTPNYSSRPSLLSTKRLFLLTRNEDSIESKLSQSSWRSLESM